MAEVILEDVTKIFPGGVEAVRDADLRVRDGELVVLVGPSGCGKSTTLRLVAGLEELTSGSIRIGNRIVNNMPPKDRGIAMVFQNYALYPHMKVYDNMAFGLKLHKFKKDEIDRRVREAGQILGITDLMERKPKALSGGQQQRVALGRAIVRKPKVFLLDEPLSNLDAKLRVQMRAELARLHDRLGSTMIYVTHDQMEAMTLGERVVVLKDGIFQQIDSPNHLYNHPVNKFVAGFIGSPPMNFIDGKLTTKSGQPRFSSRDLSLTLSEKSRQHLKGRVGQSVTFGIRPEDLYSSSAAPERLTQNSVELTVDVVEMLGSEALVYLTTQTGETLIARFNTAHAPDMHEKVEVVFDIEKAHVFDIETDKNLTAAGAAATGA